MTQTTTALTPALRARFFHGLADPARLAILDAIRDGERSAGTIALAAGLSPSTTSRHLACLKGCGLVQARQEWRTVYYRLSDGVAAFLVANDVFLAGIANQVANCDRPEMASSQ